MCAAVAASLRETAHHLPVVTEAAARIRELVSSCKRLVVLTGAGVSTDSGIPDYRGPDRPAHTPMTHQEFMRSAERRQRYWARSFMGFHVIGLAKPNDSHFALAKAEKQGHITHLITQNVDGLHNTAGSDKVVAIHGDIRYVRCTHCSNSFPRMVMQNMLAEMNPDLAAMETETRKRLAAGLYRPDGDVVLPDDMYKHVHVPACHLCGGILKPDVVFFGANLSPENTAKSMTLAEEADGLLVVGTTLTVWSSFRIVKNVAARHAKNVLIINRGETRGDSLVSASQRVHAPCSPVLAAAFL